MAMAAALRREGRRIASPLIPLHPVNPLRSSFACFEEQSLFGVCHVSKQIVGNPVKSVKNIQKINNMAKGFATSKVLAVRTGGEDSLGLWRPFNSKGIRFFSSQNGENTDQNPKPEAETGMVQAEENKEVTDTGDVNNKELKLQMEDYLQNFNEAALPSIFESILKRRLVGKHEDTDDELVDELQREPLDNVKDEDFESDFEDAHETDEEIDDLYNARDIVLKKMTSDDPYVNMDDRKWDDMIKEATEHGYLKDTRECEEILEDMLNWDKLLPDEIKEKVEKKFNEIGDRVEKGELEVEEGYALFKEFEGQIVLECVKLMEAEEQGQLHDDVVPHNKKDSDDPPGEGPILRWQTRVVFAPGGDAWHPKNRKVKLAVTVKELGLSKHQFLRLIELAGKRYNPGKDELTITSERFEHREENRKDCLRTLFALIEEAGKARALVEVARTSNVKEGLKANPKFMQRLQAKVQLMESDRPTF